MPDPVKQFLSIGVFFKIKCKKYFAQWKIYLPLQSKTKIKTEIMSNYQVLTGKKLINVVNAFSEKQIANYCIQMYMKESGFDWKQKSSRKEFFVDWMEDLEERWEDFDSETAIDFIADTMTFSNIHFLKKGVDVGTKVTQIICNEVKEKIEKILK